MGTSPDPEYQAVTAAAPGRPRSVSELTSELRTLLRDHFRDIFVEGEISGCKAAGSSGHVYFTLKDSKAAISCVMWGTLAGRLSKRLREGDKVEIRGAIDVYAQRGSYQIIVQSVKPAGLGRLYQAFLELKERLDREGLFDSARKRPIPEHPRVVGVVTSPTGAVIRDILNVLGRRAPHIAVLLYPARVQGDGAAQEIAHAIRRFNEMRRERSGVSGQRSGVSGQRSVGSVEGAVDSVERTAFSRESSAGNGDHDASTPSSLNAQRSTLNAQRSPLNAERSPLCADVLIVGRGGGSLEDLWAFNEEVVARAIAESELPIISAVGHETDFTIADFVADQRAPTPSAAAELVARDNDELLRHLENTTRRLKGGLRQRLQHLRQAPHLRARLEAAFLPKVRAMRSQVQAVARSAALQRPLARVNEEQQRLDDLQQRMLQSITRRRETLEAGLGRVQAQLDALNPRAVLARGYSITLDSDTRQAIRSAAQAPDGTRLRILLSEGELDAVAGNRGAGASSADASANGTAGAPPSPPTTAGAGSGEAANPDGSAPQKPARRAKAPRARSRAVALAPSATPDLFAPDPDAAPELSPSLPAPERDV